MNGRVSEIRRGEGMVGGRGREGEVPDFLSQAKSSHTRPRGLVRGDGGLVS